MRDKLFRKELVIGIIIIFLGASIVPSISGNIRTNSKESDEKNVYIANHIGPGVDDWKIIEVGWWHFDEGTGDMAYDSSTYDNDGTCVLTEWTTDTPDGSDYALLFSADDNSFVSVDDDPSLDFDDLGENEGFMIDFYMKKTSTPTWTYAGLVCKQYHGGYYVRYDPNSKIRFQIFDGVEFHAVSSNTLITDNDWHHIVAVWSGTTLYLYIDDMTNPDNTLYVGDFTIGETSKWLDIGNDWPTDDNNPFDGKIDEVQISKIISCEGNQPPEAPTIIGPTTGKPRKLLKFKFVSTDPEGNDICYMVSWGDGHYMPYTRPYASGEEVTFSHSWSEGGEYTIIAKAKDQCGARSPQNSIKLKITKSKNRMIVNPALLRILEDLMDHFPLLEWILLNIH